MSYNVTADGRDLSGVEWRVIPEFKNYLITDAGDIKNRQTGKLLTEQQNKTNGNWFYCLWKGDRTYNRHYQGLLNQAWPELEADWKPIPNFPGYVINQQGEVKGTRYNKLVPPDKGSVRLRKDGKRHTRRVSILVYEIFEMKKEVAA